MNSIKKQLIQTGTPVLVMLGPMFVTASMAATTGSLLEEVVVTAQKREQDISTVPISISAFSGDQLEANNICKMEDLQLLTPGFFSPRKIPAVGCAFHSPVGTFNMELH